MKKSVKKRGDKIGKPAFRALKRRITGKCINDLVASAEFLDEASDLSRKVIHGNRVEIDTKRRRKDGKLIDVSIFGAPIVHDGTQMGIYAIYRDITERKKAEEARIWSKEEARMAMLQSGHAAFGGCCCARVFSSSAVPNEIRWELVHQLFYRVSTKNPQPTRNVCVIW